ncbi:MAG: DUF6825 family protein [Cyanobacteria bacterium P01_H01_bin.15]
MDNPVLQAFYMGRALAEVLTEKVEANVAEVLSEVGKFDAEQRERLRHFKEEVTAKAQVQAQSAPSTVSAVSDMANPQDLQAEIDNLRAEIAQLRAELKGFVPS